MRRSEEEDEEEEEPGSWATGEPVFKAERAGLEEELDPVRGMRRRSRGAGQPVFKSEAGRGWKINEKSMKININQ